MGMFSGKNTDEEVVIRFNDGHLRRGMSAAKRNISKFLFSVKSLVAVAAAGMVAFAVKQGIIQDRAEKNVRRALASIGRYTRETDKKMRDTASRVQQMTKIGDEQALAAMAQLMAVGRVAPEQTEKAMMAIAGISEVYNKKVERISRTFADQLAQASSAGTTSLGEFERWLDAADVRRIRRMKETSTQAEVTAAIVDALADKFGTFGLVADRSTDQWKQLGNEIGDVSDNVGLLAHELLVGGVPAVKENTHALNEFLITLRAVAYLLVKSGGIIDVWVDNFGNRWRSVISGLKLFFAELVEDSMNKVIGFFNWLDEFKPAILQRGEMPKFDLTSNLREENKKLAEEFKKSRLGLKEHFSSVKKIMQDPDYRESVLQQSRDAGALITEGTQTAAFEVGGGGVPGEGAAVESKKNLDSLKDDIELYKAMLAGLSDAELRHAKEMIAIARDRETARKLIAEGGNEDQASLLFQRALLREEAANKELQGARDSAAKLAEEEAVRHAEELEKEKTRQEEKDVRDQERRERERIKLEEQLAEEARYAELKQEAVELAKELELEQTEESIEFLINKLEREREIKLAALQQEYDDKVDAHRRDMKEEAKHGKKIAKLLRVSRSREYKTATNFLDTMLKISAGGNKKMAKIQEAAERARLLLQLATKPIEAYAETSAQYAYPLGPILGGLHAAAVAGQIGSALSAVGGGGGGASVPGGDVGAVGGLTDSADTDTEDEEEAPPQIIQNHITVQLEEYIIAQAVERVLAQREDD